MLDLRYWTTPVHVRYELARRVERAKIKTAYAMPRWLAYWGAIRVMGHATTGKYGNQIVPDLLAMDALKRWEDGNA